MACVPVTIPRTSPSHSSTHHSLWCTSCTKQPQGPSTWQESYLLWVCSSSPHPCHGTGQSRQSFERCGTVYIQYDVHGLHARAHTKLLPIQVFSIYIYIQCIQYIQFRYMYNTLILYLYCTKCVKYVQQILYTHRWYLSLTLAVYSSFNNMFLAARSLWMKPFLER